MPIKLPLSEADLKQLHLDIQEWRALTDWLPRAKAREMELRIKIADQIFQRDATGSFPQGTTSTQDVIDLPNATFNFDAKLKADYSYDLMPEVLDATIKELVDKLGPVNIDELIRVKKELGLKMYKALTEPQRKIMEKAVVVKPKAIALELTFVPKHVQPATS